jgi:class 3 adenylate cyclase
MTETRQLAFLHADACGFTAAMQAGEMRAISRLMAGQNLLDKCARAFGGRAHDMAGDSSLMVFENARAAFLAGRRFQSECSSLETAAIEERPLPYRMGLTRGRAVLAGERLFGRSINTAARIQSLVLPGNIGVESSVWDEVRPQAADLMSRQRSLFAKHQEQAVQFVEVTLDREGASKWDPETARNEPLVRVTAWLGGPAGSLAATAYDAVLWECSAIFSSCGWRCDIVKPKGGGLDAMNDAPPLAGTDYDVQLRFSMLAGGLRIAMSLLSPHARQGRQFFTRDIATESEIMSAAADLSSLVASAIHHSETNRVWAGKNVGSFQLALAGRHLSANFSPEAMAESFALLHKGYALDPEYPYLLASLSRAHAIAWRYGWSEGGEDHLERAQYFAEAAIKLAPNDPHSRADLAFVKFWSNETSESIWHYERSLAALPFHPEFAADAGMVFSYVSRNDEAASILELSVANLPADADYRLWSLGDVYFAKHDYKTSLKWLNRMSDRSQAQRLLAATSARLGLDARPHVEAVLRQQPGFSVNRWISIQPFASEADREDYREALLLAGLPP